MVDVHSRRPSEWRRLFNIASDLIDQVRQNAGGYEFEWSFGGGTAMMIQIGHRESHDVDIFLDDPQVLGFIDPSRNELRFETVPAAYQGDGSRFQKFAFEQLGEIDFIVAGALTEAPFEAHEVEGRSVKLETISEIIAKKVYYRGLEAKPRDIFDIAVAARTHREAVIHALRAFPDRVAGTRKRLTSLNPEFIGRTITQLMITPDYEKMAGDSLDIAVALLDDVLRSPSTSS
jgi:hypothetical protein